MMALSPARCLVPAAGATFAAILALTAAAPVAALVVDVARRQGMAPLAISRGGGHCDFYGGKLAAILGPDGVCSNGEVPW